MTSYFAYFLQLEIAQKKAAEKHKSIDGKVDPGWEKDAFRKM